MRRSTQAKPIDELLAIMARLRSPTGCPWDQEQNHMSLRAHAIEEVYELIDAIESGDDHLMTEELGDLLLQVVFHCQLAAERKGFTFDDVCRHIVDKLIRRHPHVFGQTRIDSVEAVWRQWEQIKHAEKTGTRHERNSVFDGIPRHLPALMRAEKLVKKAGKANLPLPSSALRPSRAALARQLFDLAAYAQQQGWSAEQLLRQETRRQEKKLRRLERPKPPRTRQSNVPRIDK